MDGREKKLFGVVPTRLPPENIDKVNQSLLLEQKKAVENNEPFRGDYFRRNRGWITLKKDGNWYRAKIEGEVLTDHQEWEKFNNFSILNVDQNNGSSLRFLAKLDSGCAWELFTHTVSDSWLNDFDTRLTQQGHWSNSDKYKELEIYRETDPQFAGLFESLKELGGSTVSMPHWTTDEGSLQEWQDLDMTQIFT